MSQGPSNGTCLLARKGRPQQCALPLLLSACWGQVGTQPLRSSTAPLQGEEQGSADPSRDRLTKDTTLVSLRMKTSLLGREQWGGGKCHHQRGEFWTLPALPLLRGCPCTQVLTCIKVSAGPTPMSLTSGRQRCLGFQDHHRHQGVVPGHQALGDTPSTPLWVCAGSGLCTFSFC